MRRARLFVPVAAAVLLSSLLAPTAAEAAAKPRVFANCAQMQKVYKGGVARAGAKDKRKSGKAKYKPVVNTALYNANKKSDSDHDGIACEQ
ncbi:Excalibur calcium-binding domain-containing protein [Frankineae bacterium MT45]|nr:Excalibur calcium-binding domain-containing protein [Frankineae bacterium MT45]